MVPSMANRWAMAKKSADHRWVIDGIGMVHRWPMDGLPWDPTRAVLYLSSCRYWLHFVTVIDIFNNFSQFRIRGVDVFNQNSNNKN